MHIPDGFLSPGVAAGAGAVAALGLGLALRKARGMPEQVVPLMGVSGAFVFAAQMINMPVAAGTSGHLVGGALLTALLGAPLAVVTLTAVLVVQALVFQDGGLLALGANVLDMAVVGPLVAAAALRLLGRWPRLALFVGAWAGVELAALLVSVMLALSGTVGLAPAAVAMGSVHAVIGLLEGVLTVAAVGFLQRVRPDLLVGVGR